VLARRGVEESPDGETSGTGLAAAHEAELEAARRRTIELRLELARRQLDENSLGIARAHAERVLDLSPGHDGAAELLSRIEAGLAEQ